MPVSAAAAGRTRRVRPGSAREWVQHMACPSNAPPSEPVPWRRSALAGLPGVARTTPVTYLAFCSWHPRSASASSPCHSPMHIPHRLSCLGESAMWLLHRGIVAAIGSPQSSPPPRHGRYAPPPAARAVPRISPGSSSNRPQIPRCCPLMSSTLLGSMPRRSRRRRTFSSGFSPSPPTRINSKPACRLRAVCQRVVHHALFQYLVRSCCVDARHGEERDSHRHRASQVDIGVTEVDAGVRDRRSE